MPVDGDTLLERLREGDVVLLDVRPEREYAEGHLPGALSMPLSLLESRIDELPRDCAVVAYCRGPCGGASTLVDDLLDRGFERLSVVDLSEEALAHSKERLGDAAQAVEWVVGDATTRLFDEASVDLWHDRAVFHFLTDEARRDAYVDGLRASLRPGGFAIIATFGPTGPERCSGLPVTRYASADIAAVLGAGFELIDQADDAHVTPWGAPQDFAYALFRRV